MSSGCGDVLSLADLQTAKKHQLFEAEVITGKTGGIASGAYIDYATNQVTGQVQKTMPATLRDVGFTPVSWDFSTGGVLTVDDRDKVVYDPVSGAWFSYTGALPVTVPAGFNPVGSADWSPAVDPNLEAKLTTDGDKFVASWRGGTIFRDYTASQFRRSSQFGSGETIAAVGDAVLDTSNGWYYVYVGAGAFPVNVPSTPDASWMPVGTLNGYPVSHIKNWPGAENDTVKLQSMLDSCHARESSAILEGTIALTSSVQIRCQLDNDGRVTITAPAYADTVPAPYRLQFLRKNHVSEKFALTNVGVDIYPYTTEVITDKSGVYFGPATMVDGDIVIGSTNSVCHDITIAGVLANRNKSRTQPFVKTTNCWNLLIDKCSADEYSHFVRVIPTRGLVNHGIVIRDSYGNSANGITCIGDSGLDATITVERSKSVVARNPGGRAINCAFAKVTTIDSEFSSSTGNAAVFQACRVTLKDSKFVSRGFTGVVGSKYGLKLIKCPVMSLRSIYVRGGDIPRQMSTLIHDLSDIEINTNTAIHSAKLEVFDSTFEAYDRNFRVAGVTDVKGANNTFKCNHSATFALDILSTLSPMYGYIINSQFLVAAGTTNITNGLPLTFNTTNASGRTIPMTSTVVAIDTGTNLPEMNNSKTYIYSFVISDVSVLEGIADGTTYQPLTNWIGSRPSKIAFNGTAWNVPATRIPNIMVNGAIVDAEASDLNWWCRSSVVISKENVLSTRDFMTRDNGETAGNEVNAPINKTVGLFDAGAYHSAQFRAPLVRNGVVYDHNATGIVGSAFDTEFAPRTALGQKADGTYIVIVVDGRFPDSEGCSQKNLADKFIQLGCVEAYNLDGGGSSTLAINGVVVNRPSDGSQRPIPHIFNVG